MSKLKLISIILLCVLFGMSFSMTFYFIKEGEAQLNEEIYDEMQIEYDELINEYGEYSLESVQYYEIMENYKPFYPILWINILFGLIMSFGLSVVFHALSDDMAW